MSKSNEGEARIPLGCDLVRGRRRRGRERCAGEGLRCRLWASPAVERGVVAIRGARRGFGRFLWRLAYVAMVALAAACGGPAATDPLDGAWEATTRADESGVDRSVFVLEHGFLGSRRGGVVSFHNDVRLKDLAITEVRFNSPEVHLAMKATGVRFRGRLDQLAGTIVGELTYRDGSSRSLTLTRIPDRELTRPFVPAGFEIPDVLEAPSFRLRKLTEADAEKDYKAVMSSIDHIRATLPPGNWPWPGYTLRQNRRTLAQHVREFDRREAFAYTVVTPDEREVLGCVYINPYPYGRADAAVFFWVTTESVAAGVEPVVFSRVRAWLTDAWPFRSVVFPGRMPFRREEASIGTSTDRCHPSHSQYS